MSALDVNALSEQYKVDGFVKFIHKSDYSEMSEEISKALFHWRQLPYRFFKSKIS